MGYFDFLISKENKKPKKDIEYIYDHLHIWEKGGFESIDVDKRFIAVNVEILKNGSYEFNKKGDSNIYTTNYGWSFIENNKLNKIRLFLFDKLDDLYEIILLFKQKVKPKTLA